MRPDCCIAASATAGPGVTVEDLKQLPLARLRQLALPAKPVQANGGAASVGFEAYDPNNPMGTLPG